MLDGAGHLVDRDLDALHRAVDIYELQLNGANPRLLRLSYRGERLADLRVTAPRCRLPPTLRHGVPPASGLFRAQGARNLCLRHRFPAAER